jgi:hypothetical protein
VTVEDFDDFHDEAVVRPYLMTGGRTRADLPMEALVRALVSEGYDALDTKHRQIVEICHQPTGVAEVSALVKVPLTVARVLIGDLIDGRWLEVCPSLGAGQDAAADIDLVERLLSGLRSMS